MTKKFTEEQYKEIVNAWRSKVTWVSATREVFRYLVKEKLVDMGDEALALANPVTRELAHDRYVEKEKKYYWNTKKKNEHGHSMNLLHGAGGVVQMMGPKDALTELEIREWGYNPDMFDKEEVK